MDPPLEKFDEVDWDDPDAVIAFCEAQRDWLDGYGEATDPEEIEQLRRVKLRYCLVLDERGDFTTALTEARHADKLADRLDEPTAARLRVKEQTRYWIGRLLAQTGRISGGVQEFASIGRRGPRL